MKIFAGAMSAAALLASSAGHAQGGLVDQDFCQGLERVIEAARFDGGFDALERSRAAPPHLGFRNGCARTGNERRQFWMCSQNLAPAALSRDNLTARVSACLPEAVRQPSTRYREAVFALPHAQIRISEYGGPRAKVGRIVHLVVEATPAPEAVPSGE